ncbi:hypothetical protein OPS25_01350 [Alteromonas ponticola]|uniref:Uracil-DNA glycosylase-like domain-containing protein n=1 Tax=Alteromonas aquimaris TaxID=2998417 RepID=A0ABT3P310_9ALTE|nr:hypothetical protein [Alteromonas aquimaris]MCW8107148.1 hypothetical protein [Alteromonas aquimaris]
MDNNQLSKFADTLSLYRDGSPFTDELLIDSQGDLDVFFSPFEHVNMLAKVVLVGISPGATQANNANVKAMELLNAGETLDVVSEKAKLTGAFSGALRNNLVRLLDYIGINQKLSISSCESLFGDNMHLLHSTSVFRYPTLLSGKPISSANKGLTNPLLKSMVDNCLTDEFAQLPQSAFYLPMGQGVDKILLYLCEKGILSRSQLLIGMPHPSGANAERIAYFLGSKTKTELSDKTNPDKIDEAKQQLLKQVGQNFSTTNITPTTVNYDKGGNSSRTSSPASVGSAKPVEEKTSQQECKNYLNMVSPSDGYMLENIERQIKRHLAALNLSVGPVKSRTSKELAIFKGSETIAYVSRKTGLKKGHMIVALHPRMATKIDQMTGELEGVSVSPGKNSRYISSSNYRGFNSKGYSSQLKSNEHQAAAFKVDVTDGLSAFKSLLGVC